MIWITGSAPERLKATRSCYSTINAHSKEFVTIQRPAFSQNLHCWLPAHSRQLMYKYSHFREWLFFCIYAEKFCLKTKIALTIYLCSRIFLKAFYSTPKENQHRISFNLTKKLVLHYSLKYHMSEPTRCLLKGTSAITVGELCLLRILLKFILHV